MQHDLVFRLLGVGGVALTPVVADRVGENASSTVEGGGRDGASDGRVSLESVLGVFVPEVEGTVGTSCAEGSVDGVEANGVDSVDIADVGRARGGLAMTLEGEVRGGILLVDVLNGTSAFCGADGKPRGIGKATDYPRLPLERRLHGLKDGGRIVQIDDVDITICSADHEKLILDIHCVHAILTREGGDWVLLTQIPIFHRLVP